MDDAKTVQNYALLLRFEEEIPVITRYNVLAQALALPPVDHGLFGGHAGAKNGNRSFLFARDRRGVVQRDQPSNSGL